MNNTEKKLDALIDALGFDIEEIEEEVILRSPDGFLINQYMEVDYKVTKKGVPNNNKAAKEFTESIDNHVAAWNSWDACFDPCAPTIELVFEPIKGPIKKERSARCTFILTVASVLVPMIIFCAYLHLMPV